MGEEEAGKNGYKHLSRAAITLLFLGEFPKRTVLQTIVDIPWALP